ncbi:hypothetical protein Avbf_07113 [Armadillidium vulgare]|nr:hypothetical protein Avbf_07113 [Armadillidium vulgare]
MFSNRLINSDQCLASILMIGMLLKNFLIFQENKKQVHIPNIKIYIKSYQVDIIFQNAVFLAFKFFDFIIEYSKAKTLYIRLFKLILIWMYTGSVLHEKSPKILPLSSDFCSDLLIGNDTTGQTLTINDSSKTFLLERYDSKDSEEFRI